MYMHKFILLSILKHNPVKGKIKVYKPVLHNIVWLLDICYLWIHFKQWNSNIKSKNLNIDHHNDNKDIQDISDLIRTLFLLKISWWPVFLKDLISLFHHPVLFFYFLDIILECRNWILFVLLINLIDWFYG